MQEQLDTLVHRFQLVQRADSNYYQGKRAAETLSFPTLRTGNGTAATNSIRPSKLEDTGSRIGLLIGQLTKDTNLSNRSKAAILFCCLSTFWLIFPGTANRYVRIFL